MTLRSLPNRNLAFRSRPVHLPKPKRNPFRDGRPYRDLRGEVGRLQKKMMGLEQRYAMMVHAQVAMRKMLEAAHKGMIYPSKPGFIISTEAATGHSLHLTDDLVGEMMESQMALLVRADAQDMYCGIMGTIEIQSGYDFKVKLPDGTWIRTDEDGAARIETADRRVIYTSRTEPPGFNPFVNASDLLAEFVEFLAGRGLIQGEILKIPINLFINWLIVRAAEHDGQPVPEGVELETYDILPEPAS